MKAYDVLDLAKRNLRESLLRNSLTTLGIAVGVASLVAMLSLGIGLQNLASRRLTRSGLFDTVIVSSRRDFGEMRRERRTQSEPARPLDEAARTEIAALPSVREVFSEVRFPTELRLGEKPFMAMVAGLPPSAGQDEALEGVQGHFFSGPLADEVILTSDFAKDLNPQPTSLVGQTVTINYAERQPLDTANSGGFSLLRRERNLRVVGIIEREPYGGLRGMGQGNAFIPLQLAESLQVIQAGDLRGLTSSPNANGRTYGTLTVRVASAVEVEQVEARVKKMGFGAFSLMDASRNLRRVFKIFDLFLGIFGSLALAVASLGIVNTLVMAILERRREIGIMKAIGASDGDVKALFFAEAAAMGALGGALGVVLGWGIGRIINFGTNLYLQRQQMPPDNFWLVPWWLVVFAIAVSVGVTLISGLYPASRAARLDPVQALRYE